MKKALLIVLDGWGIAPKNKHNAITQASTPFYDELTKHHRVVKLHAHGTHVGLLPGYIGNSEVGHLHLGAGRPVKQDLTRIFDAIKDGSFYQNKPLTRAMKNATKNALHLIGLISDGGVHSHLGHLKALLTMAKQHGIERVYVHAILDGRDVPPKSAKQYLAKVDNMLKKDWHIATIMGRYYAMDRDQRWNRTRQAYNAIVNNKGKAFDTWQDALKDSYKNKETDEFVKPRIITPAPVQDGDSVIFFNFRNDRAKQLTHAFTKKRFTNFKRDKKQTHFVCFTQYAKDIDAPVAFPPVKLNNTLGEVISKKGLKQYRLAETEKWAHVTFFFNGLTDKQFPKEDRKLIHSPNVTTYDKTPAMSAKKLAKNACAILHDETYPFVLVNFANADMVGHTGNFKQTVKAISALDHCLSRVVSAAQAHNYAIIITADHGNAEQMRYPDGSPCTAHTTNPVPCIIIDGTPKRKTGSLYDIAPTILNIMDIPKPKEMTGKSLT